MTSAPAAADPAKHFLEPTADAASLRPLSRADLRRWLERQSEEVRAWVDSSAFTAEPHSFLRLPGAAPDYLVGLGDGYDRWSLADLPRRLPPGDYRLAEPPPAELAEAAVLGWALGAYADDRFRSASPPAARLCWPTVDRSAVVRTARAVTLIRDLVSAPANHMGPEELAQAAAKVALACGAEISCLVGEALLDHGYPLIHAVGRASEREPRLIDLRWGDPAAPRVTLIGKGVCFDSGGLDLKQPGPMTWMKKDMGGAAHALALAQMVMQAELPVRLRLLIPAVENVVSANAFRPLDVITARSGARVEIGNTDAEGRLVLADALTEAASEAPAVLLDFATLTGAATVALGEDIPALFSHDAELSAALIAAGEEALDPLWPLPLWAPYAAKLKSRIADINSIDLAPTPAAGAILGALFLQHFVPRELAWAHLDIFAWNTEARPGRPAGGEAQGLLAAYAMLARRFAGGRRGPD